MANPFIGTIKLFAGNFAPQGHLFCHGQLLPISEYDALFALLGTTYGGDGDTTFALPNLQSRVPVGQLLGPGLSNYVIGESYGVEAVTLNASQMPAHTHAVAASTAIAIGAGPSDAVWAASSGALPYGPNNALTAMSPASVSIVGESQPHNNLMPSLSLNFIIAVEGIFPPQN